MMVNDLVWKIGGEAGFGIMSSGAIFAKVLMRHGLSVCDYVEYPSLIRGGHNVYTVRAHAEKLFAPNKRVDLLVAFNKETISRHEAEVTPGGGILYDNLVVKEPGFSRSDLKLFGIPLMQLARQHKGEPVMINGIAVAASLALIGADFEILKAILTEMFERKGQEVVDLNVMFAKLGYDYIKEHFPEQFNWTVKKQQAPKRMLLSGSEAISMGAIKAGMKFFAAYPMTPINNILAYVAARDEQFGIIYKQPEDEISAINMAIGAAFTGVRAMAATAGGGFSLMVEAVGLAGMTETPVVIICGMRPGPATGLPTFTGQGDVRFVIHAAQDEFPRIVLAPGDTKEAFYETFNAFNLAEKYQLPVIIMPDKHLNESHWDEEPYDVAKLKIDRGKLLTDEAATEMGENYLRYRYTADGISPRKIPGQPGRPFLGASDEHSENSLFNEEADNRVKMMNKRMKKLQTAVADIPEPQLIGPKEAPTTIVGFGTTKTTVLEALKALNKEKPVANYLHYLYLWPVQVGPLQKLSEQGKKLIAFEGNYSAQYMGLLFEHSGVSIPRIIVKYDGRQFFPEEVIEQVTKYQQAKLEENTVEYITIGGEA